MHCFPKIQSICIDYLNSVDACSMVLYMINFYKCSTLVSKGFVML